MKVDILKAVDALSDMRTFAIEGKRETFKKQTVVGKYFVSTVNNNVGRETMIFPADENGKIQDFGDLYCERHCAYDDFDAHHARIVDLLESGWEPTPEDDDESDYDD